MKSFTNIEQSKKLAEILPIESADHHYIRKVTDFRGNPVDGEWSHPKYGNPNSKYANYIVQNFTSYEKLPCWSLSALLALLPLPTLEETPITDTETKWQCTIYCDKAEYWSELHNEPIDALIEAILIVKENGNND